MTTSNSSSSRKTPLIVGAAFLAGVVGTSAVMSVKNHSGAVESAPTSESASKATAGDADEKKPDADSDARSGGGDTVTLDPAAARNAGVRAEPVGYQAVGDELTAPGTVEVGADRMARVTTPVEGKVRRILVRLGDAVRIGQPLAVLDSVDIAQAQAAIGDADADVQQMQAGERTAQAAVSQARGRQSSAASALERQRALARAGAFSQAPLQAAQSEQSQAQSDLLSAQAEQGQAATALARSDKLFKAGIDSRAELEADQTAARQAQIRVDQAHSRVTLTKQALTREQRVFSGDLLSQREVQTAAAEVRTAQGDVQRAENEAAAARTAITGAMQKAASARTNLAALAGGSGTARLGDSGMVTVLSAMTGTVSDVAATLGQAVARTATLMTVQNLQAVVVQANVSEQDIAHIRVGQRAEITIASFPKVVFHGTVQSLGSQVDEKTRTLPVRLFVDNEAGRLRPEMFAQIRLATGASRRAIAVPATAIVTGDGGATAVYVAGEKAGVFDKRAVTLGKTYGDRVEIASGLNPEDKVVVARAFVLKSEAAKASLKDSD